MAKTAVPVEAYCLLSPANVLVIQANGLFQTTLEKDLEPQNRSVKMTIVPAFQEYVGGVTVAARFVPSDKFRQACLSKEKYQEWRENFVMMTGAKGHDKNYQVVDRAIKESLFPNALATEGLKNSFDILDKLAKKYPQIKFGVFGNLVPPQAEAIAEKLKGVIEPAMIFASCDYGMLKTPEPECQFYDSVCKKLGSVEILF